MGTIKFFIIRIKANMIFPIFEINITICFLTESDIDNFHEKMSSVVTVYSYINSYLRDEACNFQKSFRFVLKNVSIQSFSQMRFEGQTQLHCSVMVENIRTFQMTNPTRLLSNLMNKISVLYFFGN